MAVDKNKIIAEATRYVQKGQYDKAIKAYEKVFAEDRKDVRVLLKIGELHQKKGDNAAAAATLNLVAEAYRDQGFFLKAVSVYKQVAKLAPEDQRVSERLAELYQQLGLMSEAMGQLQAVAAVHERAGDQGRLLETLRRMVDLDPDNVASCVKLGDLYTKAGKNQEALELFRRAATQLRDNRRVEEYLKVAERIALLAPDDLKLTRELAHAYLSRGDTKRALAKLQLCFKADPKDIETLRLLAQAFRDLGQTSKTTSVYKELARVYEEKGRKDEARLTWKQVAELAPDDPDAQDALGASRPPPVPVARPPPPPAPRARPAPAAAPPTPRGAAAPRAAGLDSVARLLTEADVYVKYGLHQKALDHLQKVVALDGDQPDALERIRDLREVVKDRGGAAEAAERLARVLLERGPEEKARSAVERLRDLDPARPGLPELMALAGLAEPASPAAGEAPPAGEDDLALEHAAFQGEDVVAEEAAVQAEEEVLPLAEEATDEVIHVAPPGDEAIASLPDEEEVASVASLAPEGPAPVEEEPFPGELSPPEGEELELVPEEEEVPPETAEVPPSPEEAGLELAELEPVEPEPSAGAPAETAAVEKLAPEPEERAIAAEPWRPQPVPSEEAAAPSGEVAATPEEAAAHDISEELEEVAFYEGQGLLDEALDAVRALLAADPGHPLLVERARDLEAQLAALAEAPGDRAGEAAARAGSVDASPPSGPPASPDAPEDADFDIGRELAAELGTEQPPAPSADEFQYSVEDVFDQFKRGVERTVRPEDSDTHYDLGIAYREMGLIDDALGEFRTALAGANRRREVDVLSMIGLCHALKGEQREAVHAYRSALHSEYLTGEAAKALHYELGTAHEAMGEPAVALWYFQKIAKVDPRYRDARVHVERLGGGPGQPPADAAPPPSPARAATTAPPPPEPPPAGASRPGPKKNIGYV